MSEVYGDYFGYNPTLITVGTSEIDIARVVCPISLKMNDHLYIQILVTGDKTTVSGAVDLFVRLVGGSAAITFTNNRHTEYQEHDTSYAHSFNTGGIITLAGDCTLAVRGQSFGSNLTVQPVKGMLWLTVYRY